MIVRYKNYVFKLSTKLGTYGKCEYIGYTELPHKEYVKIYEQVYPTTSKRTYNVGNGIPKIFLENIKDTLKNLPEYIKRERAKKLNEIIRLIVF